MPNWCSNDLYISGSEEKVAQVLAHISGAKPQPSFDFNTVIPYPAEFKERDEAAEAFSWRAQDNEESRAAKAAYVAKYGDDKDGYNSGGYEWCSDNWGTKWNASEVQRRDLDDHVCLSFQTAWAPPAQVIVALHKIFPDVTLRLEYFERGMGFCGGFSCESSDDWYEEGKKWQAGKVSNKWESKRYRGHRGG